MKMCIRDSFQTVNILFDDFPVLRLLNLLIPPKPQISVQLQLVQLYETNKITVPAADVLIILCLQIFPQIIKTAGRFPHQR